MNYLRFLEVFEIYLLPVCTPMGMSWFLVLFISIVAYIQNPAIPMNNTDHMTRRNINHPMSLLVADDIYLPNVGDTIPTISLIADVVLDMLHAPIKRLI